MRIAFGGAQKALERCHFLQARHFCSRNNNNYSSSKSGKEDCVSEEGSMSKHEAYRQLDKLNFATAAKILFTAPPQKKKFGIDFHLVQLFFVCMPSLAVYLVAQYARHEMRRMDEELEKKKQAEEEEKAREAELNAAKEKAGSDANFLEVKERLDKLEETVKEIVVESKKQSIGSINKEQKDGGEKKHSATVESNNVEHRPEASNSAPEDHCGNQESESPQGLGNEKMSGVAPTTDASQQDPKGKTKDAGPS
ncbi:uncharacterized protein LOC131167717 [Malania oleifera]|uniref:uncharacterized protein LOC131167717 n=1 Tax=Malania oleifera TaxID=397392 RepID=UPI0025AE8D99|nr:uncharacterized protein LOC131167717 [Malania oleifera]XP_057982547.1 uncharacterized protein LOC131167717 [Malania oleifera]XP_057982548.1 uncharacterized protein LOC131167717 [Malania oleifera]XP_057982549.1 uncharacterized protein LOC131167717 [Malania oleifera]XP_057982551.1 uncharacterized protein LOC131167717 [Malania oleifera]XP_057982552.1 uncharacterized protein LOC131167717 [Malania oleifera]XP_057982553.1 uncharacterized protein LOC131167717 [Malania oleifera]XP_057982554.1 unc